MKKLIVSILFLIFCQSQTNAQHNYISLTSGIPINARGHWLVGEWKNSINFKLRYTYNKRLLLFGGGVNFSKNDISWFRYYNSNNNTIADFSPFASVGLSLKKGIVSVNPNINLGYTFLFTDIDIYTGKKNAPYLAPAIDIDFRLLKNLLLGLNATYNVTFTGLDFNYTGAVHTDFSIFKDKTIKSFTFGINLVYNF